MSPDMVGIDKTLGEGGKIELRRRWFEETRRLREFPDAGALRRLGMLEQRLILSQRAPLHLSSEPFWEAVGPSPMNMASWVMGPVAGRTTSLAVRDGDDNTLYLGTAAGGLWKSTNAGTNWQRLSDSLDTPSIGHVLAIAGATPEQDELWVGTGEAYAGGCAGYFGEGLYYSANGGASFVARNGSGSNTLNLSFINAISRHPSPLRPCSSVAAANARQARVRQRRLSHDRQWPSWTRTLASGSSMDVRFDLATRMSSMPRSTAAGSSSRPMAASAGRTC